MDPINYESQVQQPFQAAAQGYTLGQGIRNDQVQQQQTNLQLQQQQMAMNRGIALNQAAAAVAQNPTPQAVAQLSIAFPEMSKQFQDSFNMLTPAQQQGKIATGTSAYAAVLNGRPDLAAGILNNEADGQENSGDVQNAQASRVLAQVIQAHPEQAKLTLGLHLASVMGPDKFATTFGAIGPAAIQSGQAAADQATTTAGVAQATAPDQVAAASLANQNVQSQITQRASQMALDRDKLATDTQTKLTELGLQYGTPDPDTRKQINDAAVDAASQEQSAARLSDLATRVQQAGTGFGIGGKISDVWNRVFGTENGTTALKQEIGRQVNSTAIQQIRAQMGGGSRFTDTDMKVALGNVPDANSDPALISSYFNGMSKLQTLAAAQANAQAQWLSQVKHLGISPRDITVMGTQVPAGTTFADFSRQFIQQKAAAMQAQQGLAAVQGRSYMRFAAPGAGSAPAPAAGAPATPDPGAATPADTAGTD